MHISRLHVVNPSIFVRRAVALVVFAGAATLGLQAEQPVVSTSAPAVPFSSYLSGSAPFTLTSVAAADSDVGYSSSEGAAETAAAESYLSTGTSATQPPPRRRYGRPRYSDGSHNADGSNKWTAEAGVGATITAGNTHKYDTASYGFQFGAGRNFNKNVALLLQFDYDHMGLQGSTIANYINNYNNAATLQTGSTAYDIGGLDGNAHVWSFTVNPVYTLSTTGPVGAYVVVGAGFYHKVTTFTEQAESCYVYCYVYNASFDHYSSNAVGFNGGIGFTYKPSRFANERFFAEARYVFVDNQQRYGLTASNGATYGGYNYYPQNSNRTTYIPLKFGLRF